MAKIHHRQPVMLDADDFDCWFESDDRDEIDLLMQPANDDWIEVNLSN